jgi:hypothetical protein
VKGKGKAAAAAPAVLPSLNREWGFWGTVIGRGAYDPAAWNVASRALLDGIGGLTPAGARAILDGRWGRHFADSIADRGLGDEGLRWALWDYLASPGNFKDAVATVEEADVLPHGQALARIPKSRVEPGSLDEGIEAIAREYLGFETLRSRGLDRLDFRSVGVVGLRLALLRARREALVQALGIASAMKGTEVADAVHRRIAETDDALAR